MDFTFVLTHNQYKILCAVTNDDRNVDTVLGGGRTDLYQLVRVIII